VKAYQKLYNWTIGWVAQPYCSSDSDVLIPINSARLVDELLAVHGHEVLINGDFNADPHAGNILYVANASPPKLGLIDYGQVKTLSDKSRLDMAKIILLVNAAIKVDPRTDAHVDPAVHSRAKASVCKAMIDAGVKTEKMDRDVLYEMATVFMGRIDAAWIHPQNFLQWSDTMQERDPMGSLDDCEDFVMVNTCSLMIRGLGHYLQHNRDLSEAWKPFARQALQEKGQLQRVEAEIRLWRERVLEEPVAEVLQMPQQGTVFVGSVGGVGQRLATGSL